MPSQRKRSRAHSPSCSLAASHQARQPLHKRPRKTKTPSRHLWVRSSVDPSSPLRNLQPRCLLADPLKANPLWECSSFPPDPRPSNSSNRSNRGLDCALVWYRNGQSRNKAVLQRRRHHRPDSLNPRPTSQSTSKRHRSSSSLPAKSVRLPPNPSMLKYRFRLGTATSTVKDESPLLQHISMLALVCCPARCYHLDILSNNGLKRVLRQPRSRLLVFRARRRWCLSKLQQLRDPPRRSQLRLPGPRLLCKSRFRRQLRTRRLRNERKMPWPTSRLSSSFRPEQRFRRLNLRQLLPSSEHPRCRLSRPPRLPLHRAPNPACHLPRNKHHLDQSQFASTARRTTYLHRRRSNTQLHRSPMAR
jgi:hypothetical protein